MTKLILDNGEEIPIDIDIPEGVITTDVVVVANCTASDDLELDRIRLGCSDHIATMAQLGLLTFAQKAILQDLLEGKEDE